MLFNSVISMGNCGTRRSWVWRCRDGAHISRLSTFWPIYPAERTTDDPGLPSCNSGRANDRDPVATARCQSRAARSERVSFSPTGSAPGGGSPSLRTSPYMHRLHRPAFTPAPQIINGGRRTVLSFPAASPHHLFTIRASEPSQETPRCDRRAILVHCTNWTH